MNRYPLWRYIFLTMLSIVAIIYAIPNLYGEDPAIQISKKDQQELLQNQNEIPPSLLLGNLKADLNQQDIDYLSIKAQGSDFLVRFKDTEDQLKAQNIIQTTLGNNYTIALNLAPRTPAWLQAINAHPMKLGLDLRGGIHFLLQVKTDGLIKVRISDDKHNMSAVLREARIRYQNMTVQAAALSFFFQNTETRDQALNKLKKEFPVYQFSPQGLNLTATLPKSVIDKIKKDALEQTTVILRSRINELGVSEPIIQQQGSNYISVDLPGIQDVVRAKEIIGRVATLELKLQDIEHDPYAAQQTGIIPTGSELYTYKNQPILVKKSTVLKGADIIQATGIFDEKGEPTVSVRINNQSVLPFNRATAANVGKPLVTIYVETQSEKKIIDGKSIIKHRQINKIINIAVIREPLANRFQISGLASMEEAQNLALLLRTGAYVVPVDYVQEKLVGPSLGKENIRKGVQSTALGSLFVIVFMMFYYRLFGLIADIALLLNIVFIVATLSILGATLTLPGIAGIILTVGMAVDANVLIDERIREELRNGMPPQASIKVGYDRAFSTIVDANVTTLIVMLVLFALGSGAIQGFAITTIIGLLFSMLTAIVFTRAIINLIYSRGRKMSFSSIGLSSNSIHQSNPVK